MLTGITDLHGSPMLGGISFLFQASGRPSLDRFLLWAHHTMSKLSNGETRKSFGKERFYFGLILSLRTTDQMVSCMGDAILFPVLSLANGYVDFEGVPPIVAMLNH